MFTKREAILVALLVTAFWAVVFVLTSDASIPYEICEPAKEGVKQATTECARYKLISFTIHEVGTHLDIISAFITAVATAFIARYTLTLKKSTDRLWEAGDKQFRQAQASALRQDLRTQEQLRLARDEFVSNHRPIIRVRGVTVSAFGARFGVNNFSHGQEIEIEFIVSNVGSTDANVTDGRYRVYCFNTPEPKNDSLFGEFPQKIPGANFTLAPGEAKRLFVTTRIVLNEPPAGERIMRQFAVENWRMHIIGHIDYRDKLDRKRQTGFLRELEPGGGFRRIENSDYEYED